ncbi:MAG: hypothetical protein E7625_00670 [Ruminococcaceae bacterium]|nr:hypothetical protein [Oscillospiraceae bacterium]
MKKALLIFLTVAMLLSLCACRTGLNSDNFCGTDTRTYNAETLDDFLRAMVMSKKGWSVNYSESEWEVMTNMDLSGIQEFITFDLSSLGFKFLRLEVTPSDIGYYYIPLDADKFNYETGYTITVSREEGSFATIMSRKELKPDGGMAYDASCNKWFVDYHGKRVAIGLPDDVTMDRAQVEKLYLSGTEYRFMDQEPYPWHEPPIEEFFAQDFLCARKRSTTDFPCAMFPMLKEDEQALRKILDTAQWQEGTWKFGATFILSWSDLQVWLVCEPDLKQESGDPCCVMDVANNRCFDVSEEQWNVMKEILKKYPMQSISSEKNLVAYGSKQAELPSEFVDWFNEQLAVAQWTPGETKTVCEYKLLLNGTVLEYSPKGHLHDITNDRYVVLTKQQSNEMYAVIEDLIGKIDTRFPAT